MPLWRNPNPFPLTLPTTDPPTEVEPFGTVASDTHITGFELVDDEQTPDDEHDVDNEDPADGGHYQEQPDQEQPDRDTAPGDLPLSALTVPAADAPDLAPRPGLDGPAALTGQEQTR